MAGIAWYCVGSGKKWRRGGGFGAYGVLGCGFTNACVLERRCESRLSLLALGWRFGAVGF